jgi:1,4-dihydroxy-6-naphthoate synthase
LFSQIEEAIISDEVDAGVIIHENRFTYHSKGLKKIVDLGNLWEEKTNLPIPLGGIAMRRDLSDNQKIAMNRVLSKSVEYAFSNPNHSYPFVRKYAQSMDDEVMRKHIELYVNSFSLDLGEIGKKAIEELFARANEVGFIDSYSIVNPIFIGI